MKKKIKNISLTTVFGISLFLFAVIPVTVLVVNFYYIYTQSARSDLQTRLNTVDEEVFRMLQSNINYLEEQAQVILSNRSLLFALQTKTETDLNKIASEYLSKTSVSQIEFYDEENNRILSVVKKDGKITSSAMPSQTNPKVDKEAFLSLSFTEEVAVYVSRGVYENNELLGTVTQAIVIPFSRWRDLASTLLIDIFIVRNSNQLIFSSVEQITNSEIAKLYAIGMNETHEFTLGSNKYTFKPVAVGDLKVIVGANHSGYQKQLNTVTVATIITLGIVLAVLIPLLVLLSRWILSSLHHVTNAILRVSQGENPQPIKEGFGKEVGVLTQSFNVMTSKLQEAQKALQDKILELQTANQRIQDAQASMVQNAKMASLGQLVAGVAHELNNPIGFIYSNMDYLEKQTQELINVIEQDKSPEVDEWKETNDWDYVKQDLVKAIKACKDGAARTSVIVQDLRSFSRLDKGQKDEVYVEDLIENTLKLLKNNIGTKIQVKTSFSKTHKVLCNPNQINQVIVNLVMNAVQAIPNDGIITIRTLATKNMYTISIKDNGVGIPKDKQDRIFEPFYTTKEIGKGTGLGLSITYNIIKEHGGTIQLKSNINEGAEFIVSLPLNA